jgi:phosphoenolpyruvate-protein kinase (PTS system EI component)
MIPKLLKLGVTELSMSAPSIPRAKKIISGL